jgi:hypothetical protein
LHENRRDRAGDDRSLRRAGLFAGTRDGRQDATATDQQTEAQKKKASAAEKDYKAALDKVPDRKLAIPGAMCAEFRAAHFAIRSPTGTITIYSVHRKPALGPAGR